MKRILFLVILMEFIISSLFAQQEIGFEISGHLDGLKDGEKVLLGNRLAAWPALERMDSCLVSNGEFHLKGNKPVPEGPRYYEIIFQGGHRVPLKDRIGNIGGMAINLFLENGDKIKIQGGDINQMKRAEFESEVKIEGSTANAALLTLLPLIRKYRDQYGVINWDMEKIRDSIGFDYDAVEKLVNAKRKLDKELDTVFRGLPDSLKSAVPVIATYIDNYHAYYLSALYNSLDENVKNGFYGKYFGKIAKLAIGQPLPLFTLPNEKGKKIKLEDVIAKNKFTILHLWASNSYERQRFQEELITFYKKYHGKGLEVIGLSADKYRADWEIFINKSGLPWMNVSDLKGNLDGGITNDVYFEGGHSIPNTTNILVDQQGKIIAWDVYGPELQYCLRKLLGHSGNNSNSLK